MTTVFYPAIVERAEETFSVFFPDLPGCTSAGKTVVEAMLMAEAAIAGHIAEMIRNGDQVPDPSDIMTIESDPDIDEVARVLVKAEKPIVLLPEPEPDPQTAYCHAGRDGECNWAHCPQLRDNEPHTTGRHCPYDHWCYYCGEDSRDGHEC